MITEAQYKELRAKYDLYHAERERLYPGSNWIDAERAAQLPPAPEHDEISAIEVYEFVTDPPANYFAYVKTTGIWFADVTTWTGEKLGEGYLGRIYFSNMGDERRSITVHAINGKKYYGTYYKGAGDYCRLTMRKG